MMTETAGYLCSPAKKALQSALMKLTSVKWADKRRKGTQTQRGWLRCRNELCEADLCWPFRNRLRQTFAPMITVFRAEARDLPTTTLKVRWRCRNQVVDLDDDIIIISRGHNIRIAAESIRVCSRPSKGVTVMKVNGAGRVITIARAPHETEEENSNQRMKQKKLHRIIL